MNDLIPSLLSEIKQLHSEIESHLQAAASELASALEKRIEVGGKLTKLKDGLKRGEWLPFVKDNLPFSDRTAERYMKAYAKRDEIDTVSNLTPTQAYKLLTTSRTELELLPETTDEEVEPTPTGDPPPSQTPLMRSPVSYWGGKSRLARYLLPLIPQHKSYVEPFGGGASLLFAKDPNISEIEVYNDKHEGLNSFFKIMRGGEEEWFELTRRLEKTPFGRKEYYYDRKEWGEFKHYLQAETDMERARKWFVSNALAYNTLPHSRSFGSATPENPQVAKEFAKLVDFLGAWDGPQALSIHCDRFREVQLECRDYKKVIKYWDRADTFFYCDPPYVPSSRPSSKKVYKYEMTDEDHEELVEILLKVEGKVMLSGYRNDIYKRLEDAEWGTREFPTTVVVKTKSEPRIEVVWLNYAPN
jgi:DNA adenine methylase